MGEGQTNKLPCTIRPNTHTHTHGSCYMRAHIHTWFLLCARTHTYMGLANTHTHTHTWFLLHTCTVLATHMHTHMVLATCAHTYIMALVVESLKISAFFNSPEKKILKFTFLACINQPVPSLRLQRVSSNRLSMSEIINLIIERTAQTPRKHPLRRTSSSYLSEGV